MPDRERKRVPDHRSDVLKGSVPHGRQSCGLTDTQCPIVPLPLTRKETLK